MSNMSYCRFTNTLADLHDCADNMDDNDDELSKSEHKARMSLVICCADILRSLGYSVEWPHGDEKVFEPFKERN